MRNVAYALLLTLLAFGFIAVAQEDEDDSDSFAPSEAVTADTAVVFPTDI